MFKVHYKIRSPYETWNLLGVYNTEGNAISSALIKKKRGALMVRVVDRLGAVLFVH
jgi:hypothetical protein